MSSSTRTPNAVPSTITLDPDAKALLRSMCTGKTMGAFVSGLIRTEAVRRDERARLKQTLLEVLEDE